MLLPFDIGSPDNMPKPLQCRLVQVEILENRLERTAIAAVIQLHFGQSCRIERRRVLAFRHRKKLVFRYASSFDPLKPKPPLLGSNES